MTQQFYGLLSRKIFLGLIIGLFSATLSQAAVVTNIAGGNWSDPATWDLGVPQNLDDVIIRAGNTVAIDVSTATLGGVAETGGVTIGNGSTVTMSDPAVVFTQTLGQFRVGAQANDTTLSVFDASAGTINYTSQRR